MAKHATLVLTLMLIILVMLLMAGAAMNSAGTATTTTTCATNSQTCTVEEEEEYLDEEQLGVAEVVMRRILQTSGSGTKYISYETLRADRVPCSQAGASYYDCYNSSQVNPYRRSCTAITRCPRDTT